MAAGELMTYRAARGSSPDHVNTLFNVLNNGDTIKIALLAVIIAAASVVARRTGALPRWLAIAGMVFAPLLAISGLAFPLNSDALYASLAVTLIGLLVSVAALAVVIARRVSPISRSAHAMVGSFTRA
jgi:hypothetical protein